jgi:hypothetical protein
LNAPEQHAQPGPQQQQQQLLLTFGGIKSAIEGDPRLADRVSDALSPVTQMAKLKLGLSESAKLSDSDWDMVQDEELLDHMDTYLQHLQHRVSLGEVKAGTAGGYAVRLLRILKHPAVAPMLRTLPQQQCRMQWIP